MWRTCVQVVQTNGNTRLSTNLMVLSLGPQLLAKVPELTPDLTMGITPAELAKYMAGLGCTDAMNLDGGKSAQMWLKGEIVNDPCQGEDTVANSLFVIRKPEGR